MRVAHSCASAARCQTRWTGTDIAAAPALQPAVSLVGAANIKQNAFAVRSAESKGDTISSAQRISIATIRMLPWRRVCYTRRVGEPMTTNELRIFDTHVHFPRNWQNPDEDPAPQVAHLFERLREAGIVKASLLSGGRWGSSHEQCLRLLEPYLDIAVPVAVVDPDTTSRHRISQLHQMGYRGLKMIGVNRNYDAPEYFPVYAAAEALNMPIVLHLGVIGGGIDYSITHPRRDPEAAQRLRQFAGRQMARDVSATRMHPFHLDTIANNFPNLKLIGAHLGGTGNYDAAASVVRWRHNVFLDVSGGETIERHAVERRLIGYEIGIEKLTFGSDCGADEVHEHVERFVRIFDELNLTDDEKERIWYRNAAEIYGYETPTFAAE